MKTKRFLCNILFWVTLISPMISFYLAGLLGETDKKELEKEKNKLNKNRKNPRK